MTCPSNSSPFDRNEDTSQPRLHAPSGQDGGDEPQTHVQCRICHRWYQAVTHTHLRYKHGIEEPQNYKDEYSLEKITAAEVRENIAKQKFRADRPAVEYIRRNWGKRSLEEITSCLGFDASTVRAHAMRLGLGLLLEKWDDAKIVKSLRRTHRLGLPLSSGEARKKMNPLYKASIKHFGSWKNAIAEAGISYEKVARRAPFESWTKDRIFREGRSLERAGKERDYAFVQRHHSKLYAAARNHFNSWTEMLRAVGLMLAD